MTVDIAQYIQDMPPLLSCFQSSGQQDARESMKSQDTNNDDAADIDDNRLKMYTIKVELTDIVLGRNEEDALKAYQEWLAVHMPQWKILEGPKYKGTAW